jgi:hypothetical protein
VATHQQGLLNPNAAAGTGRTSLLLKSLSVLARCRADYSVSLSAAAAKEIADLCRTQPLPPLDNYTEDLVLRACREKGFDKKSCALIESILCLASGGQQPVTLDRQGALQVLAALRSIQKASCTWHYRKD